ncbi:MAG: hypothetical protein ACK40S_03560 [Burkholderiaceae bacterium]
MKVAPLIPFALVFALGMPLGVSAQTLDQLACAAGVHCSGALTPEEVRVVLGINSQHEAERAFIDASRDFPDSVWRCAAVGRCEGGMTQNEARVAIPLPAEAFAAAQVMRGREVGTVSPPSDVIHRSAKAPTAAALVAARRTNEIEVEVNKPGPREIDLAKASPSAGGEIQPEDGTWTIAHGSPRTSGTCLQGLAQAIPNQMPGPKAGPVVFQRPFNASQIIRSPQVTWQRIAPNHWKGTLAATKGQVMEMGWTVRVLSPQRMEGESTVRVTVPSACHISTPFTFTRQ